MLIIFKSRWQLKFYSIFSIYSKYLSECRLHFCTTYSYYFWRNHDSRFRLMFGKFIFPNSVFKKCVELWTFLQNNFSHQTFSLENNYTIGISY